MNVAILFDYCFYDNDKISFGQRAITTRSTRNIATPYLKRSISFQVESSFKDQARLKKPLSIYYGV
jgi:hypothetical protein